MEKLNKDWNTTKLMATGSFAVISLLLQLFGAGIASVTGVPLTSGFVNVFISPAILVICLLVINQFGSATIMELILGFLQLPFNLTGTPGFLLKIPILLFEGIIADILYYFLRKNKLIASILIGGISMLYVGITVVEIGKILNIPGIEQTAKLIYSPLIVLGVMMAGVGGYLGYLIYQKIKNTTTVRRIQGEKLE